ncbi:hypothetical protein BGZ80_010667 [Entomortierella chlamydospora]|uniref:F-box domain-containing protein n=1 Tax=Entomortierella chlamydospora TaxID=101097 RepID=A0A9P6MUE7_9FUNG|nr:hypothetical protein BGZ79_003984 [Entomortierella chlamydospora]KAG0014064.1 hypothetical protein BGZ80_010667 [Entomortierella chlamydospora]
MPNPLLIPEILHAVFNNLDAPALAVAAIVCRSWNAVATQALWVDIPRLHPNTLLYVLTRRYGHHVRKLDILLTGDPAAAQLNYVLQVTPHLKKLAIKLLDWTAQTALPIFRVIETNVAANLDSLSITINTRDDFPHRPYTITAEDAIAFFPTLSRLTKLELYIFPTDETMSIMLDSLPRLSAVLFSHPTASDPSNDQEFELEYFGDNTLRLMGQKLKDLRNLTIKHNQRITSTGLVDFSTFCKTLTRLSLDTCCQPIADGLEFLIEASPLLTDIVLSGTDAGDDALVKLAAPARAVNLQMLAVEGCPRISTVGVLAIVKSCSALKDLNFSICYNVLIDVFTDSEWKCLQLESLEFGGIHHPRIQLRNVSDFDITGMYKQLRKLQHLNYLNMSSLPIELKLFNSGRVAIESMKKLNKLALCDRKDVIEDREVIWLATRLPSLRMLRIDHDRARRKLIDDLHQVNPLLHINLVNRTSDSLDGFDESDGSDSESFEPHVLGAYAMSSDSYEDSGTDHGSHSSEYSNYTGSHCIASNGFHRSEDESDSPDDSHSSLALDSIDDSDPDDSDDSYDFHDSHDSQGSFSDRTSATYSSDISDNSQESQDSGDSSRSSQYYSDDDDGNEVSGRELVSEDGDEGEISGYMPEVEDDVPEDDDVSEGDDVSEDDEDVSEEVDVSDGVEDESEDEVDIYEDEGDVSDDELGVSDDEVDVSDDEVDVSDGEVGVSDDEVDVSKGSRGSQWQRRRR